MTAKLSPAQIRWLKKLRCHDSAFDPNTFSGKSVLCLERKGLVQLYSYSDAFLLPRGYHSVHITDAGREALADSIQS